MGWSHGNRRCPSSGSPAGTARSSGKTCYTGLPFSYAMRRRKDGQYSGELLVSRKEDSKTLTKSSIFLAYQKVRQQTQGDTPPCFKGPKAIGQIFGISYGNTA